MVLINHRLLPAAEVGDRQSGIYGEAGDGEEVWNGAAHRTSKLSS